MDVLLKLFIFMGKYWYVIMFLNIGIIWLLTLRNDNQNARITMVVFSIVWAISSVIIYMNSSGDPALPPFIGRIQLTQVYEGWKHFVLKAFLPSPFFSVSGAELSDSFYWNDNSYRYAVYTDFNLILGSLFVLITGLLGFGGALWKAIDEDRGNVGMGISLTSTVLLGIFIEHLF